MFFERDEAGVGSLASDRGALALKADHERHGRSVNIAIHQADAARPAECGKVRGGGDREVDRESALSDAALARRDGDGELDRLWGGRVAAEIAAGAGRGLRGGDGDIDHDVLHPGHDAQTSLDLFFEMERDFRVGRGERESHAGGALDQRGGLDDPKRDDVAAKTGVFDLLEVFFDVFGSHGRINEAKKWFGVETASGGVNR